MLSCFVSSLRTLRNQTVAERRVICVAGPLRTRGPLAIHLSSSRWPVLFRSVWLCLWCSHALACGRVRSAYSRFTGRAFWKRLVQLLLRHHLRAQKCCLWCLGPSRHSARSVKPIKVLLRLEALGDARHLTSSALLQGFSRISFARNTARFACTLATRDLRCAKLI